MDDPKRILFTRLLTQIRSEFDHLRWQARPIQAQLVHKATNAEAEGVRGTPMMDHAIVSMQGAGHREFYQRVDKNGHAIFRDDPILDATGKPFTNSAGEAFDIVMPAHRTVVFSGRAEDFQLLVGIAKRAGRLTTNLVTLQIIQGLAKWEFSTESDQWWALLFEIAWAQHHPLLFAERRLWLPDNSNISVPYDLQQVNNLANFGHGPLSSIPQNWMKRLPEAWVSQLDNVVTASIDVIDYLLSELTTADQPVSIEPISLHANFDKAKESDVVTIRKRFAVALSFPGEHRELVKKVANNLRDIFGESRIFYDEFHQVELARPNLDLLLQRTYGDDADLVVVFVCGKYSEKEWCGLEWRAIRNLMKSKSRKDEDVMFLRLDSEQLEGLLSIDGYIDISAKKPREVADYVFQRWTATR